MKIALRVGVLVAYLLLISPTTSPVMNYVVSHTPEGDARGFAWGAYCLLISGAALCLWHRTSPALPTFGSVKGAIQSLATGSAVALLSLAIAITAHCCPTSFPTSGFFIVAVLLNVAATGIFEELLFRGLVFDETKKKFGPLAAGVITTILFCLGHPNAWTSGPYMATVFAFGVVTAVLRNQGVSLLELGLFHAGINLVQRMLNDGNPVRGVSELEPSILAITMLIVATAISVKNNRLRQSIRNSTIY